MPQGASSNRVSRAPSFGSARMMRRELVLVGGTIRTLDPTTPMVDRLAVSGSEVAAEPGARVQRIDLHGGCVLPGFNDSHVHFPTWALTQRQVRLEDARSRADALERVGRALRDVTPGAWLRGYGWREADWAEPPSRGALDAVAGDVPVALTSKDYHSLWVNSAALARADAPLDVPGGVVERDERGDPRGVLRETAAWSFRDRYLVPALDEMVEACRHGLVVAAERGVTAVHDKDGWMGAFEAFQRLHDSGDLTLRVWQSLPADRLADLRAVGLRSGFGNDWLRLGYLKAFMDGTLGSATARLLDGSGVEITSREELEEIIRRGAERGWPVGVHAIGDQANRNALDAFEATRDAWEHKGLRQRIEHAQCLTAEDLPRFAELGIACSVQFSHAPSDRDLAERLWPDRLEGTYSFRSLLDSGAVLVNGSDAPVEELDPLAGVVAGVLRSDDERPGWRPEEALTVEQAFHATCVAPAWLSHEGRRRGKLIPGYLADLVVLDRDPFELTPEQLPNVQIVATMVGGRWVHNPPPWD
jgi:predicted amidohydrolase YtcJ